MTAMNLISMKRVFWIVACLLSTAALAEQKSVGDKAPEQGKLNGSVNFKNPLKGTNALGTSVTIRRGGTITIYIAVTKTEGSTHSLSKKETTWQKVAQTNIDPQSGNYSITLDPGKYLVECSVDLPEGVVGTRPKQKKETTIEPGRTTNLSFDFP